MTALTTEEIDEPLRLMRDLNISDNRPFPVRDSYGNTSTIPWWLAEMVYERCSIFIQYPNMDALKQRGGFSAELLVRSLGANYDALASSNTRYADELETFARKLVELPDFKLSAIDNALNGLSHNLYRMAFYMGHQYAPCMMPVLRAASDYGNKTSMERYKRSKASKGASAA